MHTLKPIDKEAINRAARDTGVIITAEEHQIGALSGRVSSVLTSTSQLYGHPCMTAAIGINDRFGDSGAPWELVKLLEVSAEYIAVKAAELMAHKREPVGVASCRSRHPAFN
jgi:transketolase